MSTIMVVLGTRPEAIKLWPVVDALQRRGAEVEVCSTGQHDTLLGQALASTGLKVDHSIAVARETGCMTQFMSRLLPKVADLLSRRQPRWTVVQGDTTSAVTAAIAAHHLRLPVAHVEAGLRSGSNRHPWPEEFNRRAISAIADFHFAPTETCARVLQAEGYDPRRIIVTGNTVVDSLRAMQERLDRGYAPAADVHRLLARIRSKRLLLLTAHRRENLGSGLSRIALAAKTLAQRSDVHLVIPLHPNPAASQPLREALEVEPAVTLMPPLAYESLVELMLAAEFILTDSGGLQEEATALNKQVLVMRERTERSEAIDAGLARLVGTSPVKIIAAACDILDRGEKYEARGSQDSIYGDGKAGERIARLLTDWSPCSTLFERRGTDLTDEQRLLHAPDASG